MGLEHCQLCSQVSLQLPFKNNMNQDNIQKIKSYYFWQGFVVSGLIYTAFLILIRLFH